MVSPADLSERLDQRLVSHGVYVTGVEADDEGLRVAYESAAPGDGVVHREVGRVCNVLLDARADGWEPVDVRGRVLDLDGDERGTWRADADWLDAVADDAISEVEFSARVLDTVEE